MKSQKRIFIFYTVATLLYSLLCLGMTSTEITLEQAIEQQLNKEQLQHQTPANLLAGQNAYHFLKRKRRYLEFPEGSSFQLVYDLIVGVVDFTNYLILGITVALAWELPSKPPSEIFKDLSERLKDGTLGTSRNDTVGNIKYIDLAHLPPASKSPANLLPMFRPPMHYQYYTPQAPAPSNIKFEGLKLYAPSRNNSWSREQNKYYSSKQPHPFAKWTQIRKLPRLSVKANKYPWWNLPERLKNSFVAHPSIRRFDQKTNYSRNQSNNKRLDGTYSTFREGTGRSEHRIYPVFGKRSISSQQAHNGKLNSTHLRYRRSGIATDEPSKLDRIHIEHHRRTRHDLYQRIELYLNGRGSHGHHCVLRALCETGQKSNEQQPGSFVGELMRAIFTMPEPLDATTDGYKEQRYDAASALKGDCAARYNHCQDSLWSSHFVL